MTLVERIIISPNSEYPPTPPYSDLDEVIKRDHYQKVAQMHIEQSGFAGLVKEQAVILKGRIMQNDLEFAEDRPEQLLAQDSSYLTLLWDESYVRRGEYLGKALIVEGLANGTIIVHGSMFFGSTILTKEAWFNNPSLQIMAIAKAKSSPTSISTSMDIREEY